MPLPCRSVLSGLEYQPWPSRLLSAFRRDARRVVPQLVSSFLDFFLRRSLPVLASVPSSCHWPPVIRFLTCSVMLDGVRSLIREEQEVVEC